MLHETAKFTTRFTITFKNSYNIHIVISSFILRAILFIITYVHKIKSAICVYKVYK